MNKMAFCTMLAGVVAATPAMAGGRNRHYQPEPQYYDSSYGSGPAYSGSGPDYAEVVSAQPIYRSVRVEEPRRECWDERVAYEEGPRYSTNNQAAGTIIGAIAGGVLGRGIAHGGANNAGTAIGAVIGAGVGNSVGRESDERHAYDGGERIGYEERCRTITDTRLEQRVDGYDVAYRYGGRVYHTTMPYDPGSRIPVDVAVRPAAY